MKVCLISVEIFAWGKYGGFGRATRIIGRELAKRGIKVFAVVPRRKGQQPVEHLDGITVLSFSPLNPWSSKALFRACDADIYHSQEPSLSSYMALKAMPRRKHMATFIDPRGIGDWWIEFRLASLSKMQVLSNYFFEDNFLVTRAVRSMDGTFCAAKFLMPKVKSKYGLMRESQFLATPVDVPVQVEKAPDPTVCFLARFDRRKRPEIFFRLSKQFPHVRFIAMGQSRDKKWDRFLRQEFGHLPNVEMTGFVDQFSSNRVSEILEKSWILVNTARREGLPNAFFEASSRKCAILSAVDPDGFASRFGYHAPGDDFSTGLEYLLEKDRWREKGERGYAYVRENFEKNLVVDRHVQIYHDLLDGASGGHRWIGSLRDEIGDPASPHGGENR